MIEEVHRAAQSAPRFVLNSPFRNGKPNSFTSWRSHGVDRHRQRPLWQHPFVFDEDFSLCKGNT
jgi:gamma-glutamylcysteine synthetase